MGHQIKWKKMISIWLNKMYVLLRIHVITFIWTTLSGGCRLFYLQSWEKTNWESFPKETGFAASYFTFSVRYWFGMGRNITTKWSNMISDWLGKEVLQGQSVCCRLVRIIWCLSNWLHIYLHLQRTLLSMRMCEERRVMSSVL